MLSIRCARRASPFVALALSATLASVFPSASQAHGPTRQRVIELLRRAEVRVHERAIKWQEFLDADEIFSTGNHSKIVPVTRMEDRDLQPGPVAAKARKLYWDWAHAASAM